MEQWKRFRAQAVIFDKDGTLIDFNAMWGGWTAYVSARLSAASGLDVYPSLCQALGYDAVHHKTLPNGRLASAPMSELRRAATETLRSMGISAAASKRIVAECWRIPDPEILAKPLTDLRALFHLLGQSGIKIAIATSDDRAPTLATLQTLDIDQAVSAISCADDGGAPKPAPDSVLTLCAKMNLSPSNVMVVGDTIADLQMARAAGAGLAVGVLSGVSSSQDLVSHANILIDSVEALTGYAKNVYAAESTLGLANATQKLALD
ncbi:MAG: HAD family hydrolase [Anaerolineales bacterium]